MNPNCHIRQHNPVKRSNFSFKTKKSSTKCAAFQNLNREKLPYVVFFSYQLYDNSSTVFSNSLDCIDGKFHDHKSIKFLNPDSHDQMGEIIEVTEGYAQNYLIPRIMLMQSLKATRELSRLRRGIYKKRDKAVAAATQLSTEIENVKIELFVQAVEEDKFKY